MNWRRGHGGGGAIDLVMHPADMDFSAAVGWLEHQLASGHVAVAEVAARSSGRELSVAEPPCRLRLPVRNDRMLGRVRLCLSQRRHLPASLLESGKLYADGRAETSTCWAPRCTAS
jgi:hypothetical protein